MFSDNLNSYSYISVKNYSFSLNIFICSLIEYYLFFMLNFYLRSSSRFISCFSTFIFNFYIFFEWKIELCIDETLSVEPLKLFC